MNIFASFPCPLSSALYLDDKRLNKMILESAQMLFTAIHYHAGDKLFDKCECYSIKTKKIKYVYYFKNTNIRAYSPTHINHPCNIWVRKTRSNYIWLAAHFQAMITENFDHRYKRLHKSLQHLHFLTKARFEIPEGPLTPHPNCASNDKLGIDFKHIEDTHLAYRMYLQARWETDKKEPTWRKARFDFSEDEFFI